MFLLGVIWMREKFKYTVKNNTFTIIQCPCVLTSKMTNRVFSDGIEEIVLCEGIETIDDSCFKEWNSRRRHRPRPQRI